MAAKKEKAPSAAQGARQKAVERNVSEAVDPRLMKALTHSTRVQCLALMVDGEWSPNQLHKELGIGLSQISYHIKVLLDYELIQLVKTEPRRGAVEHFYRAVERVIVPESMSAALPRTARMETLRNILRLAEKDMEKSLKSGTFYERPDFHASWSPLELDEQGRADLHALGDRFLAEMIEIEADSTRRRVEDGSPSIPTSVVLFAFGSGRKKGEQTSAFRQRA